MDIKKIKNNLMILSRTKVVLKKKLYLQPVELSYLGVKNDYLVP